MDAATPIWQTVKGYRIEQGPLLTTHDDGAADSASPGSTNETLTVEPLGRAAVPRNTTFPPD